MYNRIRESHTMYLLFQIDRMEHYMYNIDFNKPLHIHFIGIGGISMSGLAHILLKEGFTISGSDSSKSELTSQLKELGANIYFGQRASNITADIELIVYTAAIKADNPELSAAKDLNIPVLTRAQLLGQIMSNYNISVGVSGTHGKTTTTSMLSEIMIEGSLDPTISIGGILNRINGNIRVGSSPYFITEACEYTNSFLSFKPTIGIILNIGADHLDFFKDIDDIRNSFRLYAENIPSHGTLVINGNIENLNCFSENLECKILTFGNKDSNNFSPTNISYDNFACGSYDLLIDGKFSTHITLKVPGEHNILNSLAAIAAAVEMNIPMDTIKDGLDSYTGTERRFQYKGKISGVTIIDDYAHHPDEIIASLNTAKNYIHNKTWCVFQPHTYTRTKSLLKEFAAALSISDEIILADIYAARETNEFGVSSKDLQKELELLGKKSHYFRSFDEIENFLLLNCEKDDLLITMGAGDIAKVGNSLLGL